jgi:hypothetical protein
MHVMLFVVVSRLHFLHNVKKILINHNKQHIIRIVNFDHFIEFGYFVSKIIRD